VIRYGPVARRPVKGRREPIATYRALGPRSKIPEGHVAPSRSTAFVGRRAILERLRNDASRADRERASAVLLIVGDAGLGKSRLARRVREDTLGATVLYGRCPPYGQRLPLHA